MRISDWSSDVCSSDLERGQPDRVGRRAGERRAGAQLARPGRDLAVADHPAGENAPRQLAVEDVGGEVVVGDVDDAEREQTPVQIGRATWRERVCQYV